MFLVFSALACAAALRGRRSTGGMFSFSSNGGAAFRFAGMTVATSSKTAKVFLAFFFVLLFEVVATIFSSKSFYNC
jgi:hypothetical protein